MSIEVCDQCPAECPLGFPHVLSSLLLSPWVNVRPPSPLGWGIHPHLIIIYPPAPTTPHYYSLFPLLGSFYCVHCATCPLSSFSLPPFLFSFLLLFFPFPLPPLSLLLFSSSPPSFPILPLFPFFFLFLSPSLIRGVGMYGSAMVSMYC